MRVALEILESDLALQGRAGEAVLHAELGVEAGFRVGPVSVREAARVRPRVDADDLVGKSSACSARNAKRASSGGWVLPQHGYCLNARTRPDDVGAGCPNP